MASGLVAAELEKLKNSCLKKSGATEDTARRLVGINVVTENHVESCFLTCIYKGLKIVSSDNKFQPDTVKKIADDHFLGRNLKVTYQIADSCTKEIKADPADKCSIGASFRNCFSKYGKELGFFPHM
nr:odorant binding protein 10 [Sogatella furcifera]